MKLRWIAAAALVAVIILAAVLYTLSIDRWLAGAIATYGSEALGTEVSVDSVTLETAAGRGTVRGLRVRQPEGFGSGDAIAIDEILLDLDAASLVSGEVIVIEEVKIAAPRVAYVVKADRTSNLGALQQNLAKSSAEEAATPPPSADEPATRLRVLLLAIEGGEVNADLTELGLGRAKVPLPAIRHRDLGGKQGAPPEVIAQQVGSQFVADVLASIARSTIGKRLGDLFGEGSRGVRSLLDSLFPR